jgi:DNA/RNA endonuclease YhcR with UshA esterase domain
VKKFFVMLAIWFVAIIAIIIATWVYPKFQSGDYDELAIPYLKRIIPELSQWDPIATRALMVREVSASIPDEKFNRGMDLFSKLGTLQSLNEPKFEHVYRDQGTIIGKQTIVEYITEAKYANGDATINMKLLDRDGHFEIYHFNISSQTLQE